MWPTKFLEWMPIEVLQIVAERIAELRNLTPEQIYAQSIHNFRNLITGSPGLDKYVKLFQ
ncbi:MAG: hypothetical protein RTV72_15860 [Candidatus Thorarchaeota archaeon]